MKIKLGKTELIHFIGIGGIGMSGLALIMKGKGFRVQGSDISINKNIERLKKEKIKVLIGHKKQNINKATILVISSAIKKNNPEMLEAIKKQLPIYKRGEMLANIVSLTKNIVVVGSHGKTTTTSLIASIFQETKIDPTIVNGGVINSINNSAKLGKSEWSILEADESDGSFVHTPPTYAIITNIDREHMDYYGSMDRLNKYNYSQGAVVRNKRLIAIEGNGGTQKLLKKLKNKKFKNNGVLVKYPKKKQDLRIDLPTVGLKTFKQCKAAGLKGIVLKSKQNVFLERQKCINFANKNKMYILIR